jgi:putative membrane protein
VLAQALSEDPFRFEAHPAVWLLVAFLIGAYVYMVRVVGPHAVAPGEPVVTRRQIGCFIAAIAMLWLASDWPVHDLGEGYLYSVHMFQHMALSYFMPPLALLATPAWLLRALVGTGRGYAVLRWFTRPVVAAVLFNLAVMVSHIPGVVNTSVSSSSPLVHYAVHVMVVTTSLLMWMPVCGPLPELRIGPGAQMIYLFAQSIVPSIPAGWLAFSEGIVYHAYDQPVRVWGLSGTADQQIAGAIMKTGGTIFLWTVIIVLWVRNFASVYRRDQAAAFQRQRKPLTYADVEREFAESPAADEPTRPVNG